MESSNKVHASRALPSNEEVFLKKLAQLGLTAKYSESHKFDYGVNQYRLQIKIYRGNDLLETTTGGFRCKSDYKETAFIQGERRLHKIEEYGRHIKTHDYDRS